MILRSVNILEKEYAIVFQTRQLSSLVGSELPKLVARVQIPVGANTAQGLCSRRLVYGAVLRNQ